MRDDFAALIGDELTRGYGARFDHAVLCGNDGVELDRCPRAAEHLAAGEETVAEMARLRAEPNTGDA